MHQPVPWAAYACLAGSMALVGSYVGLSRLLVASFPVFLLAWLRFGIAALAMPHWLPRSAGEPRLTSHERRLIFLESFLGNFLFSICMLFGVALTSAVFAGVVMAAIPAAVAVLSRVFLGERMTRRAMAGTACAVAGIAALAWVKPHGEAANAVAAPLAGDWPSWVGPALLVCAMLCEASYVVIGKRLTAQISPRRISALINLWGLALVTPLGLWQALSFDFGAVAHGTWALLGFYAIAASVVTVWLWMKGLARVPAQQAGVFTVLLPISAALVGVVLLAEPFGPAHLAAFALALAGLLLATWPSSGRALKPSV